jgi:hypothetical protein
MDLYLENGPKIKNLVVLGLLRFVKVFSSVLEGLFLCKVRVEECGYKGNEGKWVVDK